jgi:hypothetical protein
MTEQGGDVRVSDDERDEAAAALGAHWETGRLALPELEQRVDAVYTATTRGQLDVLLRDLPRPGPKVSAPSGRRRRVFLPGLVAFRERIDLRASPDRAFDQALVSIVPALSTAGYHLAGTDRPTMLRFVHRRAPDWAPLAAILTLGVGLLAFAIRVDHPLTVLFLPGRSGGTRIVVFGEAPRSVRKAFAELSD